MVTMMPMMTMMARAKEEAVSDYYFDLDEHDEHDEHDGLDGHDEHDEHDKQDEHDYHDHDHDSPVDHDHEEMSVGRGSRSQDKHLSNLFDA